MASRCRSTSPGKATPSIRRIRRRATKSNGPIPDGPGENETVVDDPDLTLPPDRRPQRKIYVDGIDAIIVAERVEYLDADGKLVTESLRDFTRKALHKRFASLDDFLRRWTAAERKQAIVDEMTAEGLPLTAIIEELAKELDSLRPHLSCRFRCQAADPS